MSQPIKRDVILQPLSRDHHHALLLCWKIGKGFAGKVEPSRMKKYADWFYTNHLVPHFEAEEKHLFPILGNDHEMIKKALADHRRLRHLFEDNSDIEKSLRNIEEELEQHVRFEERTLFNEIQAVATPEQMAHFDLMHKEEKYLENTEDLFWE